MNKNSKLNEILDKANKVENNNLINNKKRLFKITYYSVDESGICAKCDWIVSAESDDEVSKRCIEFSNKKKGRLFLSIPLYNLSFEEFTDEFIESELELL